MLMNIKSSYVLKRHFSYIDEKELLKIVKYNKRLLKILKINLIDYKILSGRYLIYEEKGKAKEYNCYSNDDNNILYVGDYLNGKGKEFIGSWLLFEGEYLNGKRNGKGKLYYQIVA